MALFQHPRQLGSTGGLARALQARQQYYGRRLGTQVQFVIDVAHHVDEFIVDHLDQHLPRRQAPGYFLSAGTFTHTRNEILDDRQCHITFQQRHAHITQRILDVVLGQPPLPTQVPDGFRESISQIVKHGAETPFGLGIITGGPL